MGVTEINFKLNKHNNDNNNNNKLKASIMNPGFIPLQEPKK